MIEDFRIRVDDAVLDDLHDRLARTRLPDQIENTGWEYGVPIDYLGDLVAYWRDIYDWRAQEARLNELAHFRTRIDGQSIHFVHARSPTRGRPSAAAHARLARFDRRVPRRHPRLTDPEAHGGAATDAFHVVAPSLPGYGFSEPTRTPGWDTWRIARAFAELMRPARLRTVRRARRRLGRAGDHPHRRGGSRALRGDPPQHGDREPPDGCGAADRRGQGRPRGDAALPARGVGLRERAVDQAADAWRRAQRLAGRAARLDRREVPDVERLRRPPRERVHPRAAPHERDALLVHAARVPSSARLYWEHQHHGSGAKARRSTSPSRPASRGTPKRWCASRARGSSAATTSPTGATCRVAVTSPRWSSPSCSSTTSAPSSGRGTGPGRRLSPAPNIRAIVRGANFRRTSRTQSPGVS